MHVALTDTRVKPYEGHKVYKVAETAIIPLSAAMQRLDNSSADSTAEKR